jgi:hypothetical protein
MRGMRALRSTATFGNPLYASALADDEGMGPLWVESIIALLGLGSPPSSLISHSFHAGIPSLGFFQHAVGVRGRRFGEEGSYYAIEVWACNRGFSESSQRLGGSRLVHVL